MHVLLFLPVSDKKVIFSNFLRLGRVEMELGEMKYTLL